MTSTPPPGSDELLPEPPRLRFLRQLVTTLTVVLIVGVIAVVALLVIRLSSVTSPPTFPAQLEAPAGQRIRAATMGTGWSAIVTQDDQGVERIHILRSDGSIRQTIEIAQD